MDLVAGFHSVLEMTVRWGDMDAYQHVNNTLYFRYLESARIAYFTDLKFGGRPSGVAPVLHSATCRFRFPVTYPDTVLIASKVVELGPDRFKVYQRIVSTRHQLIAAEGHSIIAAFDYDNNRTGIFPELVYNAILERDAPVEKKRISLDIG